MFSFYVPKLTNAWEKFMTTSTLQLHISDVTVILHYHITYYDKDWWNQTGGKPTEDLV